MLKSGAAAFGGAAALAGGSLVAQQQARPAAQSPAVLRNAQTGRRFRAALGGVQNLTFEELRLLPIGDRHVVVRTEATAPCYTLVLNGIGGTPSVDPGVVAAARGGGPGAGALAGAGAPGAVAGAPARAGGPGGGAAVGPAGGGRGPQNPTIGNHTFVGVVEAVGSKVKRVQPGDRVVVGVTSQCGECYMCLRGRGDACEFTFGLPPGYFPPIAERADGTRIGAALGIGGFSEINVVMEEYTCPVFTDIPAAQLALFGDQAATGVASAMCLIRIEPGSDVVVLGAGAIGMSAIQGARIMGAAQVIAVEPIKHRRDLALKLGATTALDPNAEGANLVARIQDLCKGPTDRLFAGGRGGGGNHGPDFTIEAVGRCGDRPKVEQPPDPTGILPMTQAWQMTRRGGSIVYLGFGQVGNVSFPASPLANNGRTLISGQQGGLNMMRDIPRFVRLVERGQLDMKSMVTSTWRLDQLRDAFQVLSDRTEMCPVVLFT
jgi:S-(hydroxymethyl)glutathione dehydrogenase/alcohol dehydrogenase